MTISKVLITGGSGFVGYWMSQTQPPNMDVTYLSHADYDMFAQQNWKHFDYDGYVHLAHVPPYKCVEGARWNHARLLYCSSGIVYHPEAQTEYRRQKLAWEKYCLDSDVDLVIARLFTFYGTHLDEHKAYTKFMQAARQNSTIELWGDGKTVRSYMHGSELGKWMWAILLRGQSGEAYDVGSDAPVTMLELARRIKARVQSQSEIVLQHGREIMPHYLPVNTEKTKALLYG